MTSSSSATTSASSVVNILVLIFFVLKLVFRFETYLMIPYFYGDTVEAVVAVALALDSSSLAVCSLMMR